ncbi:unnamed protein product [Linum trigynum]|uniref:Uncharacterized protein n=1 Tax=Linum trigynum TaxID=586398 RepID=A0AAV2EAS5_9ROSI
MRSRAGPRDWLADVTNRATGSAIGNGFPSGDDGRFVDGGEIDGEENHAAGADEEGEGGGEVGLAACPSMTKRLQKRRRLKRIRGRRARRDSCRQGGRWGLAAVLLVQQPWAGRLTVERETRGRRLRGSRSVAGMSLLPPSLGRRRGAKRRRSCRPERGRWRAACLLPLQP